MNKGRNALNETYKGKSARACVTRGESQQGCCFRRLWSRMLRGTACPFSFLPQQQWQQHEVNMRFICVLHARACQGRFKTFCDESKYQLHLESKRVAVLIEASNAFVMDVPIHLWGTNQYTHCSLAWLRVTTVTVPNPKNPYLPYLIGCCLSHCPQNTSSSESKHKLPCGVSHNCSKP